MKFNPESPHRRSIRLRGYDYTQAGAYFVTICTHEREYLLGQVVEEATVLSKCGHLVERSWFNLPRYFSGVELDAFMVMPNHIHGIIIIGRGEAFARLYGNERKFGVANASPLQPHGTQTGSLGAIIQNFKSVSTRRVNQRNRTPGIPLWQRNYYEHIVRNETALNNIRRYIQANPLMWEYDVENLNRTEPIPEQIYGVLARPYGFTDEELDFIINYDIK